MKNYIHKTLILLAVTLVFGACTKDETLTIADSSATVELVASKTTVEVSKELIGQNALTISWTVPDYNFANENPTYEVYFSNTEIEATLVTTTSDFSKSYEVEEFNNALIEVGFEPEVEIELTITVVANIGALKTTSEEITVTVTPYQATIYYPELYLAGDATPAGWSETNNDYRMFKDADQGGLFYYTGYFKAGSIKLREQKNKWQPQWGKGANEGELVGNPATQSNDPEAITVETEGYYTFTVNLVDFTYTLEAYDAIGKTEYETIGTIGSGTVNGWDADIDFTKSTFDPHIWYMDIDLTGGGEFKFRENNDWTIAWGGNQDPALENYGVATSNGGVNFTVPETGNYSIIFNTLTFRYSYILNE
ncbi:MAG: SusF/SusE family outer membrane protein [Flavobacteriaceae bacterium]|nr:SusF/SusE family outer membrane protein [Flavobacteriaceae bacterium]